MYFLPAWQWAALPASAQGAAKYAQFVADSHYMGSLELETRGETPELEARVRNAIEGIDSNLMITGFQSFAHQVNVGFSQQQMIVQLTSLFGFVALALAAIGLYGVTAYAVAQRTREIGIRMALGAGRAQVQTMVLRGAFVQVGLGLLIGIPGAITAGHLMATELFGVKEWNPLVLGTAIGLLAVAALLASVLPARRAAAVEPMEALRAE